MVTVNQIYSIINRPKLLVDSIEITLQINNGNRFPRMHEKQE